MKNKCILNKNASHILNGMLKPKNCIKVCKTKRKYTPFSDI